MLEILSNGIVLAITLSAIPLATACAVGILAGIVQVATQIQEQTISILAKLIALVIVFAICGAWMGEELVNLFSASMEGARHGSNVLMR